MAYPRLAMLKTCPKALRPAAVAALLAGVLLLAAGCRPKSELATSDVRPQFSLQTLDGRQIANTDLAGKVVLIDFWATWCGPCHLQGEILKPLYQEVRGDGVEFLAVDSGEPPPVVHEFVSKDPYPYPVLLDPEDTLGTSLDVQALPTLVILDHQGRIVFSQAGVTDADTLRQVLRQARDAST